jgi:hypothetical protein
MIQQTLAEYGSLLEAEPAPPGQISLPQLALLVRLALEEHVDATRVLRLH